jgi:hypothetical protein
MMRAVSPRTRFRSNLRDKRTMKTALTVLLVGLLATTFVLPSLADSAESNPEFYFTRLIYSGGRGRYFSAESSPKLGTERSCDSLERGEGGGGGGGSWATDYPASDCKFMWGVERLSGVRVYDLTPHSVAIMDPELFKYPYLYVVEAGRGLNLTKEEAERLREYMLRGGFIHFDDFWGLDERENVDAQLGRIFPDRPIQQLDTSDDIFHTFFDVDTVMQIPNVSNACNGGPFWERPDDKDPRIFGIKDEKGRVMSVITYNSDLGDAWEWMDRPCYPAAISGQAYRMGLNFIIYSMSH